MTVGSFHGFGKKLHFYYVITDVISFFSVPPCLCFSCVKGLFRSNSRKCVALVPKKPFSYHSKKQFLYLFRVPCPVLCPVSSPVSHVPSGVPCPMSRPVLRPMSRVPCPVSCVPFRASPYVLPGGYTKTRKRSGALC